MEGLTPAQASREGLLAMWAAIDAREIAAAKAPARISLKTPMRMSGGSYAVTNSSTRPRDPVSGVPIV